MDLWLIIVIVLIGLHVWLAIVIGNAAQKKGRSKAAFVWLTLLVGPIIMGIVVATISGGANQGVSSSLTARLEEIEKLRANGVISQEEFEKKRAALLETI